MAAAFACVGLNWREHVVIDASLLQPTDTAGGRENSTKAREKLGWQAQFKMNDVVRLMVEARSSTLIWC